MALEIERKFIVKPGQWEGIKKSADRVFHITQGYVGKKSLGQTVRVRLKRLAGADSKDHAFLTIKSPTPDKDPEVKFEFEYEIPLADADEILKPILAAGRGIIKLRAEVNINGRLWEVDRFLGRNAGLILAEVEFPQNTPKHIRKAEPIPSFIQQEVTYFSEFSNVSLDEDPFSMWAKKKRTEFGLV